jgi:tetratricopeptide (TPR) repeat protein/tRNA A-37 threonylcarbamoyl transferase component Bud32
MTDPLERLANALADRYAIERELGAGGMATVYLAEDLKHERKVAVKVLRPELAAALGTERFLREIRIAARLHHPHILPLYDSGEADGFLYYVMPFVEGESLRDRLNRDKQLPLNDALRIAREVADALSYAHGQDVVHRDIKPENILLESGHAAVADFGIARAISAAGGDKITTTGMAVGTPTYMSPEQAAGSGEVDGRSDVYSLGCVLYEMLAGQPPFSGPTVASVVQQHIAADPPTITNIRPSVPTEVVGILSNALAKTPADRYGRAEDFAEALAFPVAGTGVTATRAGLIGGESGPARVAGLFVLASLGLLGVVYLLMVQLGLPSWVVPVAAVLLLVGLPIMIATDRAEQRRARASAVGGPPSQAEHALGRWLTRRNALMGGVLAFAGLGIAATGYTAMRVLGIGPPATLMATGILAERERLILADFENRTSDSTFGSTVTQLFRVGLAQSPVVNVLEPTQIGGVLARMERDPGTPLDRSLAMEVAEREGVKAVVVGEIISVGRGYALSARVVSNSGEVLTAQQESAESADGIIAAVDRLSGKLRERIGESLRTIRRNEPLEQVTTGSLRALRLYSQALRAENGGDFTRATALLEDAVAVDTAFAMAYRKLGVILANTGEQPARRVEATTKAFEHRDRLSERERYRAVGMYRLGVTQEWEQAITAYRTLLDVYPNDVYALTNLGVAHWLLRDNVRVEELAHRALALDSSNSSSYWNLAESQVLQGKFADVAVTLDRYAAWTPNNPGATYFRGLSAHIQGSYEDAENSFRLVQEAERGSLFWTAAVNARMAELATLQGKTSEAARHWRDALAATEQRGLAREYVETVVAQARADLLVTGDAEAAVRKVDAVLQRYPLENLPTLDRPYSGLITFYTIADRLSRARELLAEYEATGTPEYNRGTRALHGHAQGVLALAEGRPQEAVEKFEQADDGPCTICALPGLARAYDLAGEGDSVLALYERYVATPWTDRIELDYFILPAAYVRLGELYEERGDRERAILYYDKFVELWRNADPELQATVRDVQSRLARLVAEPVR